MLDWKTCESSWGSDLSCACSLVRRRFARLLWNSVDIPQIIGGQNVQSMHVEDQTLRKYPWQQSTSVTPKSLRLLNALNSEDRGLKVRFSLATIAFDRESAQMSQILSSQGKNAPSNPYPHYLVRLAASRIVRINSSRLLFCLCIWKFQKNSCPA